LISLQRDHHDYGIRRPWWRNAWPGAVGVLLMMLFGLVLERWLPLHFAMGIGGFAAGFVVGLIFARRSPPKSGIPGWVAALVTGLATGLCVGLLSYYFPW
jgi:fructose-specific phosphotransferase system IIC component